MTFSVSRQPHAAGILATLVALPLILAGCSGQAPGELGQLQSILAACPDQPVNVYDAVDGTGTSQDDTIASEHLRSIEVDVERAAVCGGHVTIVAFGTNSVTAPIYDGDLATEGATDLAKLRRVPGLVDDVMAEVTKNYKPAIATLPAGGTDVTGLLRLLGEARVLRPDMLLQATIYTDGLTNQGIVLDHPMTDAEATALADTVAVPDLSGASLAVVGIGRVAGDPVSSDFIAGMKTFYTRLLERTGADQIRVMTDGH